MESNEVIGIVLLAGAVLDVGIALPLVRSRVHEEDKRLLVTLVIGGASLLMAALGVAFLFGVIGA